MRPPLRDTTIGASTLTVVAPTSTPSGNERSGLGPWRSAEPPPGWNPFPDDAVGGSVAQRFLHTASRFPDKEALSSPAGSWTFAQLAADATGQAGAIASLLDESGPRPVALLITHDGPLVIALLSIILAGHIVVVVDPQAPQAEQLHVLAESGANLVLADYANAEVAAVLTAGSEQVAVRKLDELEPSHYEVPSTGPDHPIMLAFTSGTSGESKAAVVTNAVLLNLIRGATNALGIGPDDRMPMLFPTSLAVAAYPMFLPLLNGGTLATLDVRSVGLDPVADFLADERITLAYMAPTVVRFLVDALADRSFPDLRMIALGGEVVDAEVVELTRQLLGPRHIANGFGTTETGVITLYVLDADGDPDGEVPAGYPVPEVEVMILDDSGDEVPTGEAGEVAIASPHVFSGYWGHHDVDQLVLGPDPSGRDGWSHYRTGDLGRVNNDGALVVLGRLDAKVKVRGRFVVLGDVEADLHVIDGVRDAAVISRSDHGVTELDAWVALIDGSQRTGSELRAELLKDREAYRVPSKWHLVEDLPRLPNGKLDRQALRRPQTKPATGSGQGSETDHHNDIGGTTRQLRDIWEALLPGAVVGLDDDFAHLGGDSLLAAQMLVMVDRRLGVTIPMGDLVHARTLRQLGDVVAEHLNEFGDPSTTSLVQAGDPERPRLWFVHDLQGSAYRVRHVAAALDDDQPVCSFESPLLRGEPNPFTQLDTFAARYLRDLRAAQPVGPYWLAGYSFGGVCAYEIARQLRRDGDEVAFLGVIDVGPGYRGPGWGDKHPPFRPWFGVAKPPEPGSTPSEIGAHYLEMIQDSPKGALRHLMVRAGLAERIDPFRFRADLKTTGRVRPEWRLWYAWEEHWKLSAAAWDRSNTYDGRVDLFWADDTASADSTLGWGPLVHELAIHRFSGDHMGALEPRGAVSLADALRRQLDIVVDNRRPT